MAATDVRRQKVVVVAISSNTLNTFVSYTLKITQFKRLAANKSNNFNEYFGFGHPLNLHQDLARYS
jgi:hypothetical protein